jgi:hypothetical protein
MTLNEAIAFWILMVLMAGFVAWVIYLARPDVDADPHTPDRKEGE